VQVLIGLAKNNIVIYLMLGYGDARFSFIEIFQDLCPSAVEIKLSQKHSSLTLKYVLLSHTQDIFKVMKAQKIQ
jgi:hypothetical protein